MLLVLYVLSTEEVGMITSLCIRSGTLCPFCSFSAGLNYHYKQSKQMGKAACVSESTCRCNHKGLLEWLQIHHCFPNIAMEFNTEALLCLEWHHFS